MIVRDRAQRNIDLLVPVVDLPDVAGSVTDPLEFEYCQQLAIGAADHIVINVPGIGQMACWLWIKPCGLHAFKHGQTPSAS